MDQDRMDRLDLGGIGDDAAKDIVGGFLGSDEYFLVNPAGTVLNRTVLSGLFNG